ncbi:TetR/AcrR family transcriptional regulator [Halocatena marina]|uniref:TetR/AcrR family transcriptional regulator n=1 Tax=Halocatena marina TaxID=2934937 RepID=A0ABD5YWF7_9EURY|nr:TetR/AcrR family transcriptional regulator [Halocatena marina]
MTDDVPVAVRDEIARAVLHALANHGYAGLTTKKVAAESEKSEAALFYHYDTKDDLVVAFLEWAIDRSTGRLTNLDAEDPIDELTIACEVLLGDADDELDRGINVAMMELLSHAPHNERFRALLTDFERAEIETLATIIDRGIDAGVFRSVDSTATAAYILMTTDGTAGAVMALGLHDVGEQVRDRLFSYIQTEIIAGNRSH